MIKQGNKERKGRATEIPRGGGRKATEMPPWGEGR